MHALNPGQEGTTLIDVHQGSFIWLSGLRVVSENSHVSTDEEFQGGAILLAYVIYKEELWLKWHE